MKKLYFLLFPILLLTGYAAQSQCNFTSAFGTATINPAGTIVTISTCSFAGEYSTINGAVNGQTLRFTSSVATDWITVRSGTPGGAVLAFGPTPLTFANTFTGTVYAHWSTNNTCGTQSTCRTTTVQCTSCTPPPPPVTRAAAKQRTRSLAPRRDPLDAASRSHLLPAWRPSASVPLPQERRVLRSSGSTVSTRRAKASVRSSPCPCRRTIMLDSFQRSCWTAVKCSCPCRTSTG